jgi:hypothetical protein
MVGALEGAEPGGSVSSRGAALTQIALPEDQASGLESAYKADKHVLPLHGSAKDHPKAHSVLDTSTG